MKVKVKKYPHIPLRETLQNAMFECATTCQTFWQDNLLSGMGADGDRPPWKDTGEAVNDVTISPQTPTSLEYEVGGDVIQLAIAEFGREAGSLPPREPIAEWVYRKGIKPHNEDDTMDDVIEAIRWGIYNHGIRGFAPGRLASLQTENIVVETFRKHLEALEKKVEG